MSDSVDFDFGAVDSMRDVVIRYDSRMTSLSRRTQDAIYKYFHGDVDAASVAAERAFQNHRHPAAWVLELRAATRRA
jgi:metallophosphoesterase superfamily enzyme